MSKNTKNIGLALVTLQWRSFCKYTMIRIIYMYKESKLCNKNLVFIRSSIVDNFQLYNIAGINLLYVFQLHVDWVFQSFFLINTISMLLLLQTTYINLVMIITGVEIMKHPSLIEVTKLDLQVKYTISNNYQWFNYCYRRFYILYYI